MQCQHLLLLRPASLANSSKFATHSIPPCDVQFYVDAPIALPTGFNTSRTGQSWNRFAFSFVVCVVPAVKNIKRISVFRQIHRSVRCPSHSKFVFYCAFMRHLPIPQDVLRVVGSRPRPLTRVQISAGHPPPESAISSKPVSGAIKTTFCRSKSSGVVDAPSGGRSALFQSSWSHSIRFDQPMHSQFVHFWRRDLRKKTARIFSEARRASEWCTGTWCDDDGTGMHAHSLTFCRSLSAYF
jgi:hypothetical protein